MLWHGMQNSSEVKYIALIMGLFLWVPGIGITIPAMGEVYLQPMDLAVFIGGLLFLNKYLKGEMIIGSGIAFLVFSFIGSSAASTIISGDWHQSIPYLFFYVVLIAPFLLMFYQVLNIPNYFSWFLLGFLFGSLASTLLGVTQWYFAESFPSILTNQNFALFNQINRAYGLTPEASILAGLLLMSLSVFIVLWLRADARMWLIDSGLPQFILTANAIFMYLTINLLGLMLTQSSSVLLLTPVILLGVGHVCRDQKGAWYVNRLLMLFAIAFLLFVFINAARIERTTELTDSQNKNSIVLTDRLRTGDASGSMVMRGASMVAAMKITMQYPLFGVGLGQTKKFITDPTTALMEAVSPGLPTKDGVDSFFLHLAVEHGVIVYFVFIALVASIYRMMFGRNKTIMNTDPFVRIRVVLAYSLIIVATITVGYRGLYHLWMIFPLCLSLAIPVKLT